MFSYTAPASQLGASPSIGFSRKAEFVAITISTRHGSGDINLPNREAMRLRDALIAAFPVAPVEPPSRAVAPPPPPPPAVETASAEAVTPIAGTILLAAAGQMQNSPDTQVEPAAEPAREACDVSNGSNEAQDRSDVSCGNDSGVGVAPAGE